MPKKTLLLLAIATTIAIAYGSLMSSNDLPDVEVNNADKAVHAIAYGFLCLIWYLAIKSYKIHRALLIAVCFAIIYGIILEVLQGQLTVGRDSSFMDVVANSIGVVIVALFLTFKKKTIVK